METLSAFHSLYLTDTHPPLLHLLHSPPPPPPSRNLAVLLARIPGTRLARCQIVTERSTASSSPVPPRVQTFFLPFFSLSLLQLCLSFFFLICHPLHHLLHPPCRRRSWEPSVRADKRCLAAGLVWSPVGSKYQNLSSHL